MTGLQILEKGHWWQIACEADWGQIVEGLAWYNKREENLSFEPRLLMAVQQELDP